MLRCWHCFSFHCEISRDDRGWSGMKMVKHARNFSSSGEMSFKSQCRRSYANAGPYIDSDDGRHRFLFNIEMKLHHKHRRDYVKRRLFRVTYGFYWIWMLEFVIISSRIRWISYLSWKMEKICVQKRVENLLGKWRN